MSPLADAAMFQAGAVEACACERKHVERQIETEAALDLAGERVRACARCRCRDRAAPGSACRRARRRSPLRRRYRRRAACGCGPFGGVAPEIVLRGGGARGAHRGEALAVARDRRVVGIEPSDQSAGNVGGAAALAETKKATILRGSARPARPRPEAASAATAAAATGAGFRSGPRPSGRPPPANARMRSRVPSPAALSVRGEGWKCELLFIHGTIVPPMWLPSHIKISLYH